MRENHHSFTPLILWSFSGLHNPLRKAQIPTLCKCDGI